MTNAGWKKLELQQFLNDFGVDIIINNAPVILYPKKDKEHEAYYSLIGFIFVTVGLSIYTVISLIFIFVFFSVTVFIIVIVVCTITDVVLILNYLNSKVLIKPLECWVEVYKNMTQKKINFYCLTYYPVFSGKCHPNKAKNVIYKLYQEEVLKSKVDITQIEIYLELNQTNYKDGKKLGYYYQHGEGKPFTNEEINRNIWKFFPAEKALNDNFIAVANWDHQYEWRDELTNDFDKLNDLTPWIIQRWDKNNLKPLTEEFKESINWNLRYIESIPKLKPWEGALENQTCENLEANRDLQIINEAIEKIMGSDIEIKKLRDLEGNLIKFKIYFRDLNS